MSAFDPKINPLTVEALKMLVGKAEIGGYKLYPHFLVKVFNVANHNEKIKSFLKLKGFYEVDKWEKLKIVQSLEFFTLLDLKQKEILFPNAEYSKFKKLLLISKESIGEVEIRYLEELANRFRSLNKYLYKIGFYQLCFQKPMPIDKLRDIITHEDFRKAFANITEYDFYLQYVESDFVRDETATGACIDITKVDQVPRQTKEEAAQEGHWKLHIGLNMQENGQAKVDKAYDIVLSKMIEYNLVQLKVVAPFENINSMQAKEFSIYLKNQMIIELAGSENNVRKFISDVEKLFRKHDIVPNSPEQQDIANKPIQGSKYFSYRNEKARMYVLEVPVNNEELAKIVATLGMTNAIVINGEDAFFLKNGQLKPSLFACTMHDMRRNKIVLKDSKTVSSEDAKIMAERFNIPSFCETPPTVICFNSPVSRYNASDMLFGKYTGNTVIVNGDEVYFLEKGKPIYLTSRDLDRDLEGGYLAADSAQECIKIFDLQQSQTFNPFGFLDVKFKLGTICLDLDLESKVAKDVQNQSLSFSEGSQREQKFQKEQKSAKELKSEQEEVRMEDEQLNFAAQKEAMKTESSKQGERTLAPSQGSYRNPVVPSQGFYPGFSISSMPSAVIPSNANSASSGLSGSTSNTTPPIQNPKDGGSESPRHKKQKL